MRMGRREATPGLKPETNRLWGAGAPAHRHRPFPSTALPPAETCGPFPPGNGSAALSQASSSSPQALLQLKDWWRRGARQQPPGRVQRVSYYTSASAPGLQKAGSLSNWCFLGPNQGCSAKPDSRSSPLLPSAPLPAKSFSAHGFIQLLPQARQNPGLSKPCSFPALEMLRIEKKASMEKQGEEKKSV